jgi:nitroreductase
MDVFDVMQSARAMRWLQPDPVPDELLEMLVWAATRAPSPGNSQAWDFIIVTDRMKLVEIGRAVAKSAAKHDGPPISALDPRTRRMFEGAVHLATSLGEVPSLIVVAGRSVFPPGAPDERFVWATLYPAAQNLVLAARALGLGATFTTLHREAEDVFRKVLSIPDEALIAAVIPVGWPARSFGPVHRRPVAEVLHRNSWSGVS